MFVLMGLLSSSVATATTTMRIFGREGNSLGVRVSLGAGVDLPSEISDIGCFHAIYASLASSLFPTHVT